MGGYDDNEQQINTAPVNSFGDLKVNVFTANRALPVCNAQIMVYKSLEESQQDLLAVLQTDCSGETEMISLPAPLKANSLHPNEPGPVGQLGDNAYNIYYVRIMAANFITRDRMPVQIFPGIRSDLAVDMQAPIYIG